MRWAILSDIHANLQAFEAVLTDLAAQRVDRTICLGDAVGYGPQPAEVLTLVHAHVHHMLMGNHEAAVAGLMDASLFNDDAERMVVWTRRRLNRTAIRFLSGLPYEFAGSGFACVHGSFRAPNEFDYVETEAEARAMFGARPEPLLFTGHTHDPAVFVLSPDGACARAAAEAFALQAGMRYVVNPGSVGLPRGQDFRASYCILDTARSEVSFHRVVYDMNLFRRQVERCSEDIDQVAYVLGLFESRALPVLNRPVDFAAPSPSSPSAAAPLRQAARIVIRKTPADAPSAPARAAPVKAPGGRPPSRAPAVAVSALLALAAAAAIGYVVIKNRDRGAEGRIAPGTPPATAPASVPDVPALPSRAATATLREGPGPAAVVTPPVASPAAATPGAAGRSGAGGTWKAVLKGGGPQELRWDADGTWDQAGFPDRAGAEVVIDLDKKGIPTLSVILGRDITVGRLEVVEASNASVVWQAGHVMVFDNGADRARWIRHRESARSGALRLHVFTDLQLNSTLEALWVVQRGIEVRNRIGGPGGLVIHHYSNDGPANNRQVWFRGEPNTYSGGTTLDGKVSADRPSLFMADKNGAFGAGDVTLSGFAHLTLTDRGATDDTIADRASLRVAGANGARPRVILNDGVEETVAGLFFDGAAQAPGTWGAGASRAEHKNDDVFSGTGILIVRPPGTPGP